MSDLLRQLLAIRRASARRCPARAESELPSKDDDRRSSFIPAFSHGDGSSFFDRYNGWIYIAMMVASSIGSAIAGMFGWLD